MSRKAWLVCRLFRGNDRSCYESPPDMNDARWEKNSLLEKGEVYWVKINPSNIKLAFFLDAPSSQFYPWYCFEKNEPIIEVIAWIVAEKAK
jgi:hypothetical protein